jgi:hypothetical protein
MQPECSTAVSLPGVATVPFTITLTFLGAWAERARRKGNDSQGSVIRVTDSPSVQVIEQMTGGVNMGPSASLQGAVLAAARDARNHLLDHVNRGQPLCNTTRSRIVGGLCQPRWLGYCPRVRA